MTLAYCHLMPWLSETACNCMGISAIVVGALGSLAVVWWAGRA
jgi:hypothetical protein